MDVSHSKRRFSQEEKQQLLANLDIEVEHRTRQLESWLADALENFRIHHEGHPSRIPRIVLSVKMRDLEEKYQGDVQMCLRAMQMDKLVEVTATTGVERTTKKRKWLAALDPDVQEAESSRGAKNARIAAATPKKKPPLTTALASGSRTRQAQKTPGATSAIHRPSSRAPSPSPMKAFRPGGISRPAPRPVSPVKAPTTTPHNSRRPPSTTTFNPVIPKTLAYPNPSTRLPRKNERMLSMNGSPLANPFELGPGWLSDVVEEGDDGALQHAGNEESTRNKGKMKRTNSIMVRRDPSFLASTSSKPPSSGLHSRDNSQTNPSPSWFQSHSRTQSQASNASQQSHTPMQPRFPATSRVHVTVPTKDGFFLQFNPLTVSPGALEELEGITDSAKKQAREDMANLVQEAVHKWSVA